MSTALTPNRRIEPTGGGGRHGRLFDAAAAGRALRIARPAILPNKAIAFEPDISPRTVLVAGDTIS